MSVKTDSNIMDLSGKYQRKGRLFIGQALSFYLLDRKQRGRKPSKYLLMKEPDTLYLSSLYPLPEDNEYYIDYQGIFYNLKLTGKGCEIEKRAE